MKLRRQWFRPGRHVAAVRDMSSHPFFTRRPRASTDSRNLALQPGGPPDKRRRSALPAFAENIGALFSIVISLVLIAAIVALLYAFIRELRRDTLEIDAISAPAELTARGYTGAVIAGTVLEELKAIQDSASTVRARRLLEADTAIPDIQVASSGLSMKSIVRYGRRLLGMPEHRIGGEILQDPPALRMVLRLTEGSGTQRIVVSRADGDVDALLRDGGRALAQLADPYVLASYLHDKEVGADKKFPQTLAAIDYVLTHPPANDDAWAYNLLGIVRGEQGDDAASLEAYRHALALDPDLQVVAGNMVGALMATGHVDEARAYVAKREADARTPADWRMAVFMRLSTGDFRGTIAVAQRILAQDPKDPVALEQRILAAYFLHRNAEALHWAQVADRTLPNTLDLENDLAGMLILNGRIDEGLAMLTRTETVAKERKNAAALNVVTWLRGYADAQRGNLDAAITAYRTAIAAGAQEPPAFELLADALLAQGHADEALANYREGNRRLPSGIAATGMARAELALGHPDEAIRILAATAPYDPDNVRLYATWADVLDKLGKPQEAAAKRAEIPKAEARLAVPLPAAA